MTIKASILDEKRPTKPLEPTRAEGLIDADQFTDKERQAVYKAIYTRRDVRNQFLDKPIANHVLMRLLEAAHHAPSVGFSQPWNFILIEDSLKKYAIWQAFDKANKEAAALFPDEKSKHYQSLKLEGIRKSPINLCITCDRSRGGKVVLGKTHNKQMDLFSCVCAVQNLWLAARSESIGVGWVSIYHEEELKTLLNIPEDIAIIAYLCIGYVEELYKKPELEIKKWEKRQNLNKLIYRESWQG